VDAHELLPGDVVDISISETSCTQQLPVDCVLVKGAALTNEAALTGESLPVQKVSYLTGDERGEYPEPKSERHVLHAGTTLLAAEQGTKAVVVGIGVGTVRGDAVRQMLSSSSTSSSGGNKDFSKRYAFETQLALWHRYSAVVVAPLVMACMLFLTNPTVAEIHVVIVQALTTLMMVCSPYLPVALNAAYLSSGKRLETNLKLYVMDKSRIPVMGSVDVFCFDKTGTLTEEKMRFYGEFNERLRACGEAELLESLAVCHCLKRVNGTLTGHPVERQLVRALGWTSEEHESSKREMESKKEGNQTSPIEIMKRWEFDQRRVLQSVFGRRNVEGRGEEYFVCAKGSVEKISRVCRPDTLPPDLVRQAREFSKQGFYTLAIAKK
ncbi:unnamed protein product, partial [Amoebophrya sp. A25]